MENKTSKYFKYAIGEIVQGVIGILIALQINNWNTKRLVKANEAHKNALVDLYNFRLLRLNWLRASMPELQQLILDIDNEIIALQ